MPAVTAPALRAHPAGEPLPAPRRAEALETVHFNRKSYEAGQIIVEPPPLLVGPGTNVFRDEYGRLWQQDVFGKASRPDPTPNLDTLVERGHARLLDEAFHYQATADFDLGTTSLSKGDEIPVVHRDDVSNEYQTDFSSLVERGFAKPVNGRKS